MDDDQILRQIGDLVDQEHRLRRLHQAGELDSAGERARLTSLEEQLDQCWDLLRQRRARQEFGQNADEARVRPPAEVEGYLQ